MKELVSAYNLFSNRIDDISSFIQNMMSSNDTWGSFENFELSEEQKKAVENRLLKTTRYVEFEMHYKVDAALIGGMEIRIGDRVVDSSIRTKLQNLTRELSKIQLKVGE